MTSEESRRLRSEVFSFIGKTTLILGVLVIALILVVFNSLPDNESIIQNKQNAKILMEEYINKKGHKRENFVVFEEIEYKEGISYNIVFSDEPDVTYRYHVQKGKVIQTIVEPENYARDYLFKHLIMTPQRNIRPREIIKRGLFPPPHA
ncbi:hypothetical protein GJ688_12895 [Heliobacillus mobilis]|uniref:DUF3139 domain-containing protein n=1 Tax=Heliobacterium mobile TaxID=28064 RepID=A0A6I3SLP9_HELMO|nr:DUF3139 domain-containing protein [Heliobacterium mobile]MTV49870.1 hypothetical protein [Heliobacterium mobile]